MEIYKTRFFHLFFSCRSSFVFKLLSPFYSIFSMFCLSFVYSKRVNNKNFMLQKKNHKLVILFGKHSTDGQFHLLCGQFHTQLAKECYLALLNFFLLRPKHQNTGDFLCVEHFNECIRFEVLKNIFRLTKRMFHIACQLTL